MLTLVGEIWCCRNDHYCCYYYKEDGVQVREYVLVMTGVQHGHLFAVVVVVVAWVNYYPVSERERAVMREHFKKILPDERDRGEGLLCVEGERLW